MSQRAYRVLASEGDTKLLASQSAPQHSLWARPLLSVAPGNVDQTASIVHIPVIPIGDRRVNTPELRGETLQFDAEARGFAVAQGDADR